MGREYQVAKKSNDSGVWQLGCVLGVCSGVMWQHYCVLMRHRQVATAEVALGGLSKREPVHASLHCVVSGKAAFPPLQVAGCMLQTQQSHLPLVLFFVAQSSASSPAARRQSPPPSRRP